MMFSHTNEELPHKIAKQFCDFFSVYNAMFNAKIFIILKLFESKLDKCVLSSLMTQEESARG